MNDVPPGGSVPSVPLRSAPPGQWSVLGALGVAVVAVGGAFIVGNALSQAYLVWRLGIEAAADLGASQRLAVPEQHLLFVSVQLGAQLFQLAAVLLLARIWHRDWKEALGLVRPNHGLAGWIGAALLLFAVKIVATMVAAGLSPASPRDELAPFVSMVRAPLAWLLFLVTVLLAGATEELVFRGVLSRTLEATRLGFWGGAALTSASFAVLHMQYGLGGQIVIFAIAMTLAWIRASSGSLWPAIFCHALNNGIAMLAMRAIA